MSHFSAIVLGATGLVGKALVKQLLNDKRYHHITLLVRRPLPDSLFADPEQKLQVVVTDFDKLDDYQGYFSVDHAYVCLGTTIKQAGSKAAFRKVDFEYVHAAAQCARAQHCQSFVWISSIGANANSSNFYLRVKGELENAILPMLNLRKPAAVQPSLLLGEREESRPLERLGILFGKLVAPLMIGPLRKYRPVEADTVARNMMALQDFSAPRA
ncbi:NAD(P)H-binding protein [Bowmanella sp. JS7-9]|uniref:NAD(P)H-binding protein n=1 Tax=Pseudobowmanella zhangzhouensis TaxID=1537679 RepID=A0ABW1XH05_9ALTE|nr:NAD(P)H-binding protein [Bowmanella sp. JS7-9]TBX21354.1 epimerase [Bowmanella sp. JS7-9]